MLYFECRKSQKVKDDRHTDILLTDKGVNIEVIDITQIIKKMPYF